LIAELTEIESGRNNARQALAKALWHCRVHRATLLIAKLDRLARNVALIADLMESEVRFVVADMPLANRFTLHILAAVAEYESKLKSERIKAALVIARERGRKFGIPPGPSRAKRELAAANASRLWRQRALAYAKDVLPELRQLRAEGRTYSGTARALTEMGVVPPGGGERWHPWTVRRILARLAEPLPRGQDRLRDRARSDSLSTVIVG